MENKHSKHNIADRDSMCELKDAVMPSGCLYSELPQGNRPLLDRRVIHFWHTALS